MSATGETDLQKLVRSLEPKQHPETFVFCKVHDLSHIGLQNIQMFFKEEEGITIIIEKEQADLLRLSYSAEMSWITLTVYSSLTAVGLTAAFSKALAEKGISCNVVAAFHHDHIFVARKDADAALGILTKLPEQAK
jgi:uncharacterized protein